MSLRRRLERAEAAVDVSPILAATGRALRALEAVDAAGVPPKLRAPVEVLRARLGEIAELARKEGDRLRRIEVVIVKPQPPADAAGEAVQA